MAFGPKLDLENFMLTHEAGVVCNANFHVVGQQDQSRHIVSIIQTVILHTVVSVPIHLVAGVG